jgi:hypothetical protein
METAAKRRFRLTAWAFLAGTTAATFFGFMFLDPDPNVALALFAAANVAIIELIVYRLYQLDLLLSPMAAVVIGPGLIVYYSWGNLGARIVGEGRFGGNPGSLEFYPIAAMLTTVGLVLFAVLVFVLFPRQAAFSRIRYSDLYWKPWQAPMAALVAAVLLLYLSLKYPFVNGYFLDVESNFDRWLSASQYFLVILAVVIGVSVVVRASGAREALLGLIGIGLPMLLAVGLRSRSSMVSVIVTAGVCWITLRPKHSVAVIVGGALCTGIVFSLGTVVKAASIRGETTTIVDNLLVIGGTDLARLTQQNRGSAEIDFQYRVAGFELPAALIGSMVRGTSPMYGEALYGGMLSGLPGFMRPAGEHSERLAILKHFYGRGLLFGDSIGVPLTSGLADWGIWPSPLIYAVIALYCLAAWRTVQLSPRVFVAYLMAGVAPGDLFWENGLFAIRAIGFAWLALLVTGPLLMPRWQGREAGRNAAAPKRARPGRWLA